MVLAVCVFLPMEKEHSKVSLEGCGAVGVDANRGRLHKRDAVERLS